MSAKRGRIAHQQQIAPYAGPARDHAANGWQRSDLALRVAARQGAGDDVARLAHERIDVSLPSLRCSCRSCYRPSLYAHHGRAGTALDRSHG